MTKRQGATTDNGFFHMKKKIDENPVSHFGAILEPFWRQFGNIGVLVNFKIQDLQSESLSAAKIPVFHLNLDSRGPILQ